MMPQGFFRIPPAIRGWVTQDKLLGGYWQGGRVRVHWGWHGSTWITVEWASGRWMSQGPFESVAFHYCLRSHYGGDVMSFLSKRLPGGSPASVAGGSISGSLAGLPAVLEYLQSGMYPDGAPRLRSTLLVLVEDGSVKLCLSDRDQEQSLWRSGSSLEDALLALEATLSGEHQDWRRSGGGGGAKPQARRK
jgi:hypothetical protein